jgi:RNA polymerase sigma-70 factor (ECF subfamily)
MKKEKDSEKVFHIPEKMEIFKEKTGKDFLEFYDKYLPKLIFHNNKYLNDTSISEDIAIDAIIKSLQKIDTYDSDKARFSTWLFTISKNDCIQYKNNFINRNVSVDKFVDEEGTTIKDFLNDSSVDDELVKEMEQLNNDKANLLKEKIELLKDPYRKVIKLREIDEKSYRDITILLKEDNESIVDDTFFNNNNVIHLVDPEIIGKKESLLMKFCEIYYIEDISGNLVDFEILGRDKDNLITSIKLPEKNYYTITGQIPYNISTIKSQIRNGRKLLQDMVQKDFMQLNEMYL